ncbi:MAG: FHA domain-containing protein [Gemmatimonadetes bacterium]|nr:FHA domain-containing protein [Gemmatimonadota bacterium]NIO31844.1 FHA domain-containing protein [Gemmatimonadota bacterium]
MPFIEFQQSLYRLKSGENLVGSDETASIRLAELGEGYRVAISIEEFGAFAWAVQDAGPIAINDRPLQRDPVALFNGDRLSLDGRTIVFIDDGGEDTVKLDAPVPAAIARTVAESEANPGAVAPELLHRVTPPEEERRVVAVLRRIDNNQSYIIDRAGFRIGREKRSDLIIPDRKISRLHAEITYQRGQYLLRDLGRTKTKVNGRKISEPYKLQVGDVLQIGKYQFAFLRRVASGEDIVKETEITPVRAAVPDAVTVGFTGPRGSRALSWILYLALAAAAALILLG